MPVTMKSKTAYSTALKNATAPTTDSKKWALSQEMGFNYRQVIGGRNESSGGDGLDDLVSASSLPSQLQLGQSLLDSDLKYEMDSTTDYNTNTYLKAGVFC